VVNRTDCGPRPLRRNRGKPIDLPARSPERLAAQLPNARARPSNPVLNASFDTCGHHRYSSCLISFHRRRNAANDQPWGSVTQPPNRHCSHWRASRVVFTSASIRLNATRAAPTWDANARRCAGVGSNANR
jgi:hypothetical protein